MKDYKNILIVRTDRIGDVVLTTPVVKALRAAYPDARIVMLVSKQTVDLMNGNPYLDEVLVDDREGAHKGLTGYLKLIKILKDKKFDLALVYHTKKRTNALMFLARIPQRVGFKDKKFGFLLTDPIEDQRRFGKKHEVQYCLDVLRHLDIPAGEPELFVPVHQEAEQWFDGMRRYHQLENNKKLIILHPGASDPSKQWPVGRFVGLIEGLAKESDTYFVLIGAENIVAEGEQITQGVKGGVINLIGKTTVGQMASLLNHADLLISNDSGPVHVAAAVGTPVISIFTRNQPGINPERWKPLGAKAKIVSVPLDEAINFQKAGKRDEDCGGRISVQEVLDAVRVLQVL